MIDMELEKQNCICCNRLRYPTQIMGGLILSMCKECVNNHPLGLNPCPYGERQSQSKAQLRRGNNIGKQQGKMPSVPETNPQGSKEDAVLRDELRVRKDIRKKSLSDMLKGDAARTY